MEYQTRIKHGEILLKIAAILLLLSCFISCRTSEQLLNKALKKDTAYVIGELRKIAPCIVTKRDTTFLPGQTLPGVVDTFYNVKEIEVACPDSAGVKVIRKVTYNETTYSRVDTLIITRTINIHTADKGDSILAAITIAKQNAEIRKQTKKKDFWFVFAIVLGIILAITLVGKAILRSLPGSPK